MLKVYFLLLHLLSSATAVVTATLAAIVAPVSPALVATLQKKQCRQFQNTSTGLLLHDNVTWEGYEGRGRKLTNKCVKELVDLLMYSRFTPTCFGKWLQFQGVVGAL
jgi:hypothetical protein